MEPESWRIFPALPDRMKKLFLSLLAPLLLFGCADPTTQFAAVPTASIHSAMQETGARIDSAADHAKKIKAEAKRAGTVVPDLKDAMGTIDREVDSLTADLLAAKNANATAESRLKVAEAKIKELIDKANTLGNKFTELVKKDKRIEATLKMMKSYWGLGAVAYGIGQLLRHILILVAVLLGLCVIGFLVSLACPQVALFFEAAGPFVSLAISRLTSLFKKK